MLESQARQQAERKQVPPATDQADSPNAVRFQHPQHMDSSFIGLLRKQDATADHIFFDPTTNITFERGRAEDLSLGGEVL